ncbi:hypothetical protein [Oceanibacterium hippocampi]|uniref:Phosphatidate cytidylyltransferase n=1 Tax=Oceanibacterium hippocampi TaxID=745714 RepID=A0A1Y5TXG5_9PROT|nr:hypothetical protein [Oceanibacterium hippocampi]SLN76194.1 hypothetical protein OCH7691_04061 [Oceanibacterium hippocampi]
MGGGTLHQLLAAGANAPPLPGVDGLADAAVARHGSAIVAVLLYGSCLRDRIVEGRMLDFYLICDGYRSVHRNPLMRLANWLVPPNVYYIEGDFDGIRVRAKYALVSLDQFERRNGPGALLPYFWGRFAQPTAILRARDEATRERLLASLARAARTLLDETRPLVPAGDPDALWTRALGESYATELRAESPDRARELFEADAGRYRAVAAALDAENEGTGGALRSPRAAARRWRLRRLLGKLMSVVRLLKASTTFEGGADYLAWKIERHSGVPIELTPWQRRHPVLASVTLFARLRRRRAFR